MNRPGDEVAGVPHGELAKRQEFEGVYVKSLCPGCGAEVTRNLGNQPVCYPGMNGPPFGVYFYHQHMGETREWWVKLYCEVKIRLATPEEIEQGHRGPSA